MSMSMSEKDKYRVMQREQDFFRDAIKFSMDGEAEKLEKHVKDFLASSERKISSQELFMGFQSEGRTLVHLAAHSGHAKILDVVFKFCDDKKFFVNLPDARGFTPLMNATISESSEMMQTLVDLGANVNMLTQDGSTALHFAAGDGSVARCDILIKAGAKLDIFSKMGGSALHWAAGKGRTATIEYLVSKGVDVNALSSDGLPPVIMACVASCEGGVVALVKAGADCGHIMSGNLTALHICAEHGLTEAVRAILATPTGQNCVNMATNDDNKPIHLAAMHAHRAVMELLLEPTTGIEKNVDALIEEGITRLARWERLHAPAPANATAAVAADASGSNTALPPTPPVSAEDEAKAEKLKEIGNNLYKKGAFADAVAAYTNAIAISEYNPTYYSNRSAAHLANNDAAAALRDAELCRRLKPDWPKGCFRQAAALLALNRYEDSACAAFEGCKLDDKNEELKVLLKKAVKKGQEEHKAKQAATVAANAALLSGLGSNK